MIRKLLSITLAVMFMVSTMGTTALAADNLAGEKTVMEKLNAVETEFYGNMQTGAILERLNKLEKDLYGVKTDGAMISRVDSLYEQMFENKAAVSMTMQLNASEWTLVHNLTYGPMKTRIEKLETLIEGAPKEGAYSSRLQSLNALAFTDGIINVENKQIPANHLIKIKLVTPIDSQKARVGDTVKYQAAEDLVIDGVLLVAKGEKGQGKVISVSQAQNFGRDAKVEIDFKTIDGIDGSKINTFLGKEAKEEMKSMAMAAGASVAGIALLGPVGIVGGIFVKGKKIDVPTGSEMYIQTKEVNSSYGFHALN